MEGGFDLMDIDFIGRTWRPAEEKDFAFFFLNAEHYMEDKHFEFNRTEHGNN